MLPFFSSLAYIIFVYTVDLMCLIITIVIGISFRCYVLKCRKEDERLSRQRRNNERLRMQEWNREAKRISDSSEMSKIFDETQVQEIPSDTYLSMQVVSTP